MEEGDFDNHIWYTCKFCLQLFNKKDQVVQHQKRDHANQLKQFVLDQRLAAKKIGQARDGEVDGQFWNRNEDNFVGNQSQFQSSSSTVTVPNTFEDNQSPMSSPAEFQSQNGNRECSISPLEIVEQPCTSNGTTPTMTTTNQTFSKQSNYHRHPILMESTGLVQEEYVYCCRCDQNVFSSNVDVHALTCQQNDYALPPPVEVKSPPKLKEKKVQRNPRPIADRAIRPKLTYACLSALALKNSTGRLATSSIYEFICDHFPYYRTFTNSHWKNSLRHSLATNPAFVWFHQGNGEGDTKGQCWKRGYWAISPEPMKALKMEEKLRLVFTKNRESILMAMSDPENLSLIESGNLKRPLPEDEEVQEEVAANEQNLAQDEQLKDPLPEQGQETMDKQL